MANLARCSTAAFFGRARWLYPLNSESDTRSVFLTEMPMTHGRIPAGGVEASMPDENL